MEQARKARDKEQDAASDHAAEALAGEAAGVGVKDKDSAPDRGQAQGKAPEGVRVRAKVAEEARDKTRAAAENADP